MPLLNFALESEIIFHLLKNTLKAVALRAFPMRSGILESQ
jgi:hypothetical protein